LYIVYCVFCIVYCILHIVYCILYIVYCILCIVYCILCIVYCILCIVYCILYIAATARFCVKIKCYNRTCWEISNLVKIVQNWQVLKCSWIEKSFRHLVVSRVGLNIACCGPVLHNYKWILLCLQTFCTQILTYFIIHLCFMYDYALLMLGDCRQMTAGRSKRVWIMTDYV
jgi:hypothetical protein